MPLFTVSVTVPSCSVSVIWGMGPGAWESFRIYRARAVQEAGALRFTRSAARATLREHSRWVIVQSGPGRCRQSSSERLRPTYVGHASTMNPGAAPQDDAERTAAFEARIARGEVIEPKDWM